MSDTACKGLQTVPTSPVSSTQTKSCRMAHWPRLHLVCLFTPDAEEQVETAALHHPLQEGEGQHLEEDGRERAEHNSSYNT